MCGNFFPLKFLCGKTQSVFLLRHTATATLRRSANAEADRVIKSTVLSPVGTGSGVSSFGRTRVF